VAIDDVPAFNGHIIGEDYYPSRASGVDISVSLETSSGDSTFLKVVDADRKPLAYIANEMITRTNSLRDGTNDTLAQTQKVSQIVNLLPNIFGYYVKWGFSKIGSYGFTVSALGIEGFPHGVCTVVSVPRSADKQSGEAPPEHEMSVSLVPQMTDSTAPITVSIAGVSLLPSVDKEKKVTVSKVLSLSIAIDTNAGSLANGRRFCARLQHYLNNPMQLDKVDRMAQISKEDMTAAEAKAAEKLAAYKQAAADGKKKK
jgi:pyruvate/2-oxoglutarate dehydrogenase complex dihydrolipoamide acyltransferase (E2) component